MGAVLIQVAAQPPVLTAESAAGQEVLLKHQLRNRLGRSPSQVALVDENGPVVLRKRIGTGTAGLTALLEIIAESGGPPDTTPIAIETDKSLLVVALAEAGFPV